MVEHITTKLSKEELKTNFKQHVVDVTSKARKETKEASAENRFKVVNYFRHLDNLKVNDPDEQDVTDITVIDIEDIISSSTKENGSEEAVRFYDL